MLSSRRFTTRVALAAGILLQTCGLIAATVQASPWSAPSVIAAGSLQFAAGGADGTLIVGWRQTTGGEVRVFAALKTDSGPWMYTDPLPVGALPTSVAVDAFGNTIAVWTTASEARAGYLPAGTTVWQIGTIATEPAKSGAVVVVDSAGLFTAAWIHAAAGGCIVRSATWSSATGVWSAPAAVSPADECASLPTLAVSASGRAVALWNGPWATGIYVSSTPQVRVAERAADGSTWAASVVLVPAGRVQYAKYSGVTGAALSPSGEATVVWFIANKVWASSKPAGSTTWGTKKSIGSSGSNAYTRLLGESGLAMDAHGNIEIFYTLLAYNVGSGNTVAKLKTRARPAGGTWVGGGTVATDKTGGAGGFGARLVCHQPSSEFGLLWAMWDELTGRYTVESVHTVGSIWSNPPSVLGETPGDPPGAVPVLGLAVAGNTILASWTDLSGDVVVSLLQTPGVF
jgi:hypothetical protein